MQELAAIAEMIRVGLETGSWDKIMATDGFMIFAPVAVTIVPASIIALGIGLSDWHETPLGVFMGATPPDENWAERARDIDKDGLPDF